MRSGRLDQTAFGMGASGRSAKSDELKSKTKWDGNKLKVSSKSEFNGNEFTQDETWTLSGDGKTLTIDNSIKAPQGEFSTKSVFTKGS